MRTGSVPVDIGGHFHAAFIQEQLGHIIIVSTFERVGFPFIEVIAQGFPDSLSHRIVVVGRGGDVLDRPGVEVDMLQADRADLHVNRRSDHDGRRGIVLHIAEFIRGGGCLGDRPLQLQRGIGLPPGVKVGILGDGEGRSGQVSRTGSVGLGRPFQEDVVQTVGQARGRIGGYCHIPIRSRCGKSLIRTEVRMIDYIQSPIFPDSFQF